MTSTAVYSETQRLVANSGSHTATADTTTSAFGPSHHHPASRRVLNWFAKPYTTNSPNDSESFCAAQAAHRLSKTNKLRPNRCAAAHFKLDAEFSRLTATPFANAGKFLVSRAFHKVKDFPIVLRCQADLHKFQAAMPNIQADQPVIGEIRRLFSASRWDKKTEKKLSQIVRLHDARR